MTFQVRHPVVENQFSTFYADSSETSPIAAGKLVKIVGETADGRAIVDVISDASTEVVYGWLMQKVKEEHSTMPPNFLFKSDMGSSDAFFGDPVGIAMGPGAVYETDQYVDAAGGIVSGALLYAENDGKLSEVAVGSAVAQAISGVTATEAAAGKMLMIKALV